MTPTENMQNPSAGFLFLKYLLASFLFLSLKAGCLAFGGLLLAEGGHSGYRIWVGVGATPTDLQAAGELRRYLGKISGADIPCLQTETPPADSVIWIGSAGHVKSCPVEVDWQKLAEDGFRIVTSGNRLILAGGSEKGTLYAVYTFLETYLGCRKYSPNVEYIPRHPTLSLPAIDDIQVPVIKFRDAHFYDPGYMAWHKLDNHDSLFGMYVHTFGTLLPPEKYFKDHPEYFSKVKSGRIPDGQLCLSNPQVYRIVADELRSRMNKKRDFQYWSVSQNDNFSPCQCDSCRSVDEREGSPSGLIISMVNRIAAEFPEKTISTLAYQYTRGAPAHAKPLSNVNIMLCTIECNRSSPISSDPGSESFRKDIQDWRRLTTNIYLWDYVVQFRNLQSPFPNLRVLQPNIQFFVKNGVTAVFEQGSGTLRGEFKELRTYLISKLLWNPYLNVDSLMNDFLRGYYGQAAPFIRDYIYAMHDAIEKSGEELSIYGFPLPSEKGYLSPRMMDTYDSLLNCAEEAVRQLDEKLLERVRIARLPLQFAILEQAKAYGTAARGFYMKNEEGAWQVKPKMEELLNTFVERCKGAGITALDETGTRPDDYMASTRKFLGASMRVHKALFKPVSLKIPASRKYHNGDETALTDGLTGLEDYHMNWLGFEGEDMEAVLDLGSVQTVERFSTSFLQDNNAWVFMPLVVEYSVSDDGKSFRTAAQVKNTVPADKKGSFASPFTAVIAKTTARYIRVKATNMKTCPDWHKGAGGLAWIFADEIIVE